MELIPRIAEMAKQVQLPDMSANRQQVQQNNALISRLEEAAKAFLPVEEQARKTVTEQLSAVKSQNAALLRQIEVVEKTTPIVERYKRLSLDPLRWRDGRGLPRLVVFSTAEATFSLSVERDLDPEESFDWPNRVRPTLPAPIAQCYADVFAILDRRRWRDKNVRISCSFNGVIPSSVRQRISEAKKEGLFDGIYLISEPGPWQIDVTTPMPAGDPLVVGYCQDLPKSLWLITSFDVTPIEQAMISYTSMPDKAAGGKVN